MKTGRYKLIFVAFAMLTVLSSFVSTQGDNINRFEFTYNVKVPKQDKGENIELWIPIPQNSEVQTIEEVAIESPVRYQFFYDGIYDNKYIYINAKNHTDVIDVIVKIKATRKERIGGIIKDSKKTEFYLKENSKVIITDDIRKDTKAVVKGLRNTEEKAKAIYDYVVKNISYDKSGCGWGNGDVIWVCNEKRGNCTDFHSLFIAMCRSEKIPARFTIGFPFPEKTDGEEIIIKGYHCWAEFYIDGKGWIAVDASEAFKNPDKKEYLFSNLDNNRIAYTLGRDIELLPGENAPNLNYFIYPHCRINGEEVNVEKKFTYQKR